MKKWIHLLKIGIKYFFFPKKDFPADVFYLIPIVVRFRSALFVSFFFFGMTKFRLLLFLCFVFDVFATRPQLVDQKLWFINRTVLNFDYEVAVVQMEFDQDMYLTGGGESFLCGLAEEPCPERDCVPCDWSSQQVFFFLFSNFLSHPPKELFVSQIN